MKHTAALAPLAVALSLLSPMADAHACTPIDYGVAGNPASLAREMVGDAKSVELMRVVSREPVPAARQDPIYPEYYGQVFAYRLETVAVLSGRSRGPLILHGLASGWLQQRLPRITPVQQHAWWSERGWLALQETRIPDPTDAGSIACAVPMTLDIGAEYLVFREGEGGLLAPGYTSPGRARWRLQRPVLERVDERRSDPWLREVRQAIALKPEPSPWEVVFELVFGDRSPR